LDAQTGFDGQILLTENEEEIVKKLVEKGNVTKLSPEEKDCGCAARFMKSIPRTFAKMNRLFRRCKPDHQTTYRLSGSRRLLLNLRKFNN
jgi:hypothetical protein